MANKLLRIGVATLFNLFFEYSVRGVGSLRETPFLLIIIFLTYLTLFTMEDALIQRYKLQDYHLVILAFTYGMIYQCLVSGSAFVKAQALGINWAQVLFTVPVWWGLLQSVFTFYLANRIAPRNWNASPTHSLILVLALLVNMGMVALFQRSGFIPTGTPIGYLMMVVVAAGAAVVFALSLRGSMAKAGTSKPHPLLDVLGVFTVIVFLYSAFFLQGGRVVAREATVINMQAAGIVVPWTILVAVVVVGYRLIWHRPIPI